MGVSAPHAQCRRLWHPLAKSEAQKKPTAGFRREELPIKGVNVRSNLNRMLKEDLATPQVGDGAFPSTLVSDDLAISGFRSHLSPSTLPEELLTLEDLHKGGFQGVA